MNVHQHFGLSRPPFQMVGQPDQLYMSKSHNEGLSALEWGLLHEPGNFTLLLGEVGTGKTTLIGVVLNRHYELARIANVMNPKLGFEEMLRVILEQLGYLPSAVNKLELLKKFERVLRELRPKERIAIIIDEAQALSDDTLEELRLFSNYARDSHGHLEILLVGQPELLTRLMAPSLRQFHQRIGARAVLHPLTREEALAYIDHKLRNAGGSASEIFDRRALQEIVGRSQGIPRQLNLLCNNALIRAYAVGARRVSLKIARAAVSEYDDLGKAIKEFPRPVPRPHRPFLLAGLGLASLAGLSFFAASQAFKTKPKPSLEAETKPAVASAKVVESHQGDPSTVRQADTSAVRQPDGSAVSAVRQGDASTVPHLSAAPDVSTDVHPNAPKDVTAVPALSSANSGTVDTAASAPKSISVASVANPRGITGPDSDATVTYSVRSGDTIEKITLRRLGTRTKVRSVIEANPQLRDANRIYPGETVFLPTGSKLTQTGDAH